VNDWIAAVIGARQSSTHVSDQDFTWKMYAAMKGRACTWVASQNKATLDSPKKFCEAMLRHFGHRDQTFGVRQDLKKCNKSQRMFMNLLPTSIS